MQKILTKIYAKMDDLIQEDGATAPPELMIHLSGGHSQQMIFVQIDSRQEL